MNMTEFDTLIERHRALVNGASPSPSREDHDRAVLAALTFARSGGEGDSDTYADTYADGYSEGYRVGYAEGYETGVEEYASDDD